MLYLVIYLLIGMAFAIFLPIRHLQTQAAAKDLTREQWQEATEVERSIIQAAVSSHPSTWMWVIIGLLWPLQIVVAIVGEVMSARIRARRERGE